ncbi:PREDICTED: interferon gamma receptor 1 [Elephantulus edwardii]|uniref:interferon gamma receptor 1 n=1 Tax=Elephantulus edwardii TaxID=28737 RepID=UPI0003F05D42|nr:PREDICTED: interferon gamma receptor 1 [Elephantulus edwardii]
MRQAAPVKICSQERGHFPVPTNIKIESYDMHPVLYWDYEMTVPSPVFTVQVKTYWNGIWLDACVNISDHQCNLYQQIKDPSISFWAKVKARVGQRESDYVETKEFVMCSDGKVGPPTVDVRRKENQITVSISHPLITENGENEGFEYDDYDCDFIYKIYVRSNGSEARELTETEACSEPPCQISFAISSENAEYCVSAIGVSDSYEVKTGKSEEYCITSFENYSNQNSLWIPVACAVLFFVGLITFIAFCQIKKINPFKRKNIALPKSLLSVVKHATSETKPESKYVSLIMSYQPVALESEKGVSEEQLSTATVSDMHTRGDPEKVEPTDDSSSKTEVVIIEENSSDVLPGSATTPVRRENSFQSSSNQSEPGSDTLNLYHSRNGSDSGLVESDSLVSDLECPTNPETEINTEVQDSIVTIRNTTTSFGYDKPHVLVDLLVDDGGKESLIGYRLPADSKDLS